MHSASFFFFFFYHLNSYFGQHLFFVCFFARFLKINDHVFMRVCLNVKLQRTGGECVNLLMNKLIFLPRLNIYLSVCLSVGVRVRETETERHTESVCMCV